MAIVLGYDLESTGLDTSTSKIIEVGAVIWDTEEKLPLALYSTFVSGVEILPEHKAALDVNKINPAWLKYGKPIRGVFEDLDALCRKYGVEYVVAHNGENYDKPLTLAEVERIGDSYEFTKLPWVDTRHDLPFEVEPKSRSLNHLALDQGFINHFAHRAVFDVMTMLKVMSKYDFEAIVQQSKIPWVVVRALVGYDDRELAKARRYSWENLGERKYPKCWVKKIRETKLLEEQKEATFQVVKIE